MFLDTFLHALVDNWKNGLVFASSAPTEGATAQHFFCAYLQTQDRMLLSLDPSGYGWTVGSNGYESVPMLDPVAPEEFLKFISCNCKGVTIMVQLMSSVSQHVKIAKALHERISLMMEGPEKIQTFTPEALYRHC